MTSNELIKHGMREYRMVEKGKKQYVGYVISMHSMLAIWDWGEPSSSPRVPSVRNYKKQDPAVLFLNLFVCFI